MIKADYCIKNFDKINILSFLANKKRFMLNHNYFKDGVFITKQAKLSFLVAYRLEGKIYLFNVVGKIKRYRVKAKEIVYNFSTFKLKKCEITLKNRIRKKRVFIID